MRRSRPGIKEPEVLQMRMWAQAVLQPGELGLEALVVALPEPAFASEAPPAPSSRVCWALPALPPRSVVSKL